MTHISHCISPIRAISPNRKNVRKKYPHMALLWHKICIQALVRAHNDAEYGHQNGELNYWLPLTCRSTTCVDLWCESKSGAGDFHPLKVEFGEVASFHGSSCWHYVNANHSVQSRVSLDFRVGVEGYFDPHWQMIGTTDDHSRRSVTV